MSSLSKQKIQTVLMNEKLELRNIQLSEEMIDRFLVFCSLLQKWNEKINLTSEKDALSIFEKHVFDSLQYLRWLDSSQKTLDIGSGAGFPGIPAKIIYPDLPLILMESQRKRCSFLREAVRSLNLAGAEVAEGRAEGFFNQETFSNHFDRVVFRGFSSLKACLAVGLPFLKEGGKVILKKSSEEMPDSSSEIDPNSRIVELKTVQGLDKQESMMMVFEKCST